MNEKTFKWTRDVSLRWTHFSKAKKMEINVHFWTTTGVRSSFLCVNYCKLAWSAACKKLWKILYGVKCQQAWNYTTESIGQSRAVRSKRSGSTSNSSAPVLHQMIPEQLFQEWMTQWLQGQKWWQKSHLTIEKIHNVPKSFKTHFFYKLKIKSRVTWLLLSNM